MRNKGYLVLPKGKEDPGMYQQLEGGTGKPQVSPDRHLGCSLLLAQSHHVSPLPPRVPPLPGLGKIHVPVATSMCTTKQNYPSLSLTIFLGYQAAWQVTISNFWG